MDPHSDPRYVQERATSPRGINWTFVDVARLPIEIAAIHPVGRLSAQSAHRRCGESLAFIKPLPLRPSSYFSVPFSRLEL